MDTIPPRKLVDPELQIDPDPVAAGHREPGVPPETNDDYDDDPLDHEGADSFPASDPSAHY